MQQQPPLPGMPANFPLASITTDQIQKYLDENKQLILAILDNQNLGKLAECAQYQAQLQKNLLYLAAIADAQPQLPAMRAPTFPNSGTSPYFQQQQLPMFSPRPPSTSMAFNPGQQFHRPQQLLSSDIKPAINNGDTSAGYSDAIRRNSVEDRGGLADNRNPSMPPSSSSPLQRV